MKRRRLPLTALRSFEVAGRLENITGAAEELFVSQAAVSRQVRDLEAMLGQKLFERNHRRIQLTPDGARLLNVLSGAFDSIDSCLMQISNAPQNSAVSVSVEPSFAACWLVQNLAEFRDEFPSVDVNVESNSRLTEFRSHGAELAIRFSCSKSKWLRSQSHRLYDVEMTPVRRPVFSKRQAFQRNHQSCFNTHCCMRKSAPSGSNGLQQQVRATT